MIIVVNIPHRQALTFGGSRDVAQISFHQIRRLTDKAGLPQTPVVRLVRETAEATAEAWSTLSSKDILPRAIRTVIDAQINSAASSA